MVVQPKEHNWRRILGWEAPQIEDLRRLAQAYVREGHYRRAIPLLKAVCHLDPACTVDLQLLGALYLQVGEYQEALSRLREALKREKSHLPSQLNRAKALLLSGNRSQGFHLLHLLKKARNRTIRQQAEALLLAHHQEESAPIDSTSSPQIRSTSSSFKVA